MSQFETLRQGIIDLVDFCNKLDVGNLYDMKREESDQLYKIYSGMHEDLPTPEIYNSSKLWDEFLGGNEFEERHPTYPNLNRKNKRQFELDFVIRFLECFDYMFEEDDRSDLDNEKTYELIQQIISFAKKHNFKIPNNVWRVKILCYMKNIEETLSEMI